MSVHAAGHFDSARPRSAFPRTRASSARTSTGEPISLPGYRTAQRPRRPAAPRRRPTHSGGVAVPGRHSPVFHHRCDRAFARRRLGWAWTAGLAARQPAGVRLSGAGKRDHRVRAGMQLTQRPAGSLALLAVTVANVRPGADTTVTLGGHCSWRGRARPQPGATCPSSTASISSRSRQTSSSSSAHWHSRASRPRPAERSTPISSPGPTRATGDRRRLLELVSEGVRREPPADPARGSRP